MVKKSSKTQTNINNKHYENQSPKADDGVFIHSNDKSFSSEGSVRYGEESDSCDL